jgi:hypothetical protein
MAKKKGLIHPGIMIDTLSGLAVVDAKVISLLQKITGIKEAETALHQFSDECFEQHLDPYSIINLLYYCLEATQKRKRKSK